MHSPVNLTVLVTFVILSSVFASTQCFSKVCRMVDVCQITSILLTNIACYNGGWFLQLPHQHGSECGVWLLFIEIQSVTDVHHIDEGMLS